MKWFKHYSDNHRGQSVNALMDELGYFGPFIYYTIYEICSEKLQGSTEQPIGIDDCIFRLHRRVVCSATRAKPSSVTRGLTLGQSCGLWSFKIDGDYFEIKIPILLDLLDSDQKKTRLKRDRFSAKKRLDKEEDKEEEVVVQKSTTTIEEFYVPDDIMQTLKTRLMYPESLITEIAHDAWLIYLGTDPTARKWPRFLTSYFKNEKERIQEKAIELSKPRLSEMSYSEINKHFFPDGEHDV